MSQPATDLTHKSQDAAEHRPGKSTYRYRHKDFRSNPLVPYKTEKLTPVDFCNLGKIPLPTIIDRGVCCPKTTALRSDNKLTVVKKIQPDNSSFMEKERIILINKILKIKLSDIDVLERVVDGIIASETLQNETRTSLLEGKEEYSERRDKKENIIEFINRVWKDQIDGLWARSDLRRLSPKTEANLRNYERTNGRIPLDVLNVPNLHEKNIILIKNGRIEELRKKEILTASDIKELAALRSFKIRNREEVLSIEV